MIDKRARKIKERLILSLGAKLLAKALQALIIQSKKANK